MIRFRVGSSLARSFFQASRCSEIDNVVTPLYAVKKVVRVERKEAALGAEQVHRDAAMGKSDCARYRGDLDDPSDVQVGHIG